MIGRQTATVADEVLFLGDNLLPWLLLALGAALVAANLALLIKPPRIDPNDPNSPRRDPPPLGRVAPMLIVGVVISVWALASFK